MAKSLEIDAAVRDALAASGQPGNSATGAEVMRLRVAAGDTGTTVAGLTAPGWAVVAPFAWHPWVGVVAAEHCGSALLCRCPRVRGRPSRHGPRGDHTRSHCAT
ncbi:MAG: hypothetical protein ACOH1J_02595 [Microbacteriaceae bacterium]